MAILATYTICLTFSNKANSVNNNVLHCSSVSTLVCAFMNIGTGMTTVKGKIYWGGGKGKYHKNLKRKC